ncbi:MAG TPA: carboxypeptidase regulatory-like domain-containing protein, partial [Gemmatimonadaceae bacterium]|nr:carboxypeptidase regulatory-like domain-containing protein [Gemmatimonadaceae bacterium]
MVGIALGATFLAGGAAAQTGAQASPNGTGRVVGYVTDSTGTPLAGATVQVKGARLGARTGGDGRYHLEAVPAGNATVIVAYVGFAPDSSVVAVAANRSATHDVHMRNLSAYALAQVLVLASPRLSETKAAALARQREADNIVSVLSGDEIRSLPNFNAAEAAGRIPGVSLERDEGEGQFIQVRGTEPRLSNVTIDGSHVPGTESDRIPKLDDVPSDLLGAIEVSKTLTADMDADAIGGSVNLVTKTPEGAPRGYVAGQYGQIDVAARNTYQGGLTYGGRFGDDGKLGFLIGGSADQNNRAIEDVEPSWGVYNDVTSAPNDWSQRDYRYDRSRYGIGGDLDYRFDSRNQVYIKGLWSLFHNFGTRYVFDVSGDSAAPSSATGGALVNPALQRQSEFRTPSEQMWGLTAGGKHDVGRWTIDYTVNYAGTRQQDQNYRSNTFNYDGPTLGDLPYSTANPTYPTYRYQSAGDSSAAMNPSNYMLAKYSTSDHLTTGRDIGGGFNFLLHWTMADDPAQLKFGVHYRDERKVFTDQEQSFKFDGETPLVLSQVESGFSDPGFYNSLEPGYSIGPVDNNSAVNAYENTHSGSFVNTTDPLAGDSLGSFSGSEKIYAAYVMNTTDFGPLRLNLGLRVERTHATYLGHSVSQAVDSSGDPTGPEELQLITGAKDYTDLFPSVQ